MYRGEQKAWLDRLEREHDNLRAAEGLREAIGARLPPAERAAYERDVITLRAAWREEALAAA